MKLRLRFTFFAALLALGLQSGCVAGLPGAAKPAAGNPVAGSAITVTSLDDAPEAAAAGVALRPKPRPVAAETAAKPVPPVSPVTPEAAAPADVPAPAVPAVPAVPAKPKSPEEIRCGKKGGSWLGAGETGAQACVKPTRDGGQRCSRQSDCEGLCLARSATCAPVQPLFGCNDILQDNGLRVTLCID